MIVLEDLHLLCPAIKRGSSAASTGDAANSMRITAQLIKLIDDLHKSKHNIMCLATTSNPEELNELLQRPGRFDKEIIIPTPNQQVRKEFCSLIYKDIFENFAKSNGEITDTLLESLSLQTQGCVAADLVLLIRNIQQSMLRSNDSNLSDAIQKVLKTVRFANLF